MSKYNLSVGLRPITYEFKEINGIVYMFDNLGFIVDKEEIETLTFQMLNSIKNADWKDVKDFNFERDKFIDEQNKIQFPKEESKPKKPQKGYIYFVKDDKNNVKIGRTKNMKSRFGEYTKLSFEPVVLKIIESNDMVSDEAYYHNMFLKKHKRGEWFELTDSDIEFIKNI